MRETAVSRRHPWRQRGAFDIRPAKRCGGMRPGVLFSWSGLTSLGPLGVLVYYLPPCRQRVACQLDMLKASVLFSAGGGIAVPANPSQDAGLLASASTGHEGNARWEAEERWRGPWSIPRAGGAGAWGSRTRIGWPRGFGDRPPAPGKGRQNGGLGGPGRPLAGEGQGPRQPPPSLAPSVMALAPAR